GLAKEETSHLAFGLPKEPAAHSSAATRVVAYCLKPDVRTNYRDLPEAKTCAGMEPKILKTNALPAHASGSRLLAIFGALTVLMIFANRVEGFALLGPYMDWMAQTNGYRQPGDIGGPMNIGEGYRWNV